MQVYQRVRTLARRFGARFGQSRQEERVANSGRLGSMGGFYRVPGVLGACAAAAAVAAAAVLLLLCCSAAAAAAAAGCCCGCCSFSWLKIATGGYLTPTS